MIVARAISQPLILAARIANTVAAGDLCTEIALSGNDETGQVIAALRHMNEELRLILNGVKSGAENVATASRQIASGNIDLSSRTEEQASSLQQTAAAMEQITSSIVQASAHSRQADALAVNASTVAGEAGQVVTEVVTTMSAIKQASTRIVEIIAVIDGIAFQTNILALNAAVEAARAGDEGRGFAVVAAEVRNLAQRSATAAREIKGLIDDTVEQVGVGSLLVQQAGETMRSVVGSVEQVTAIVAEIARASDDQSKGITEINFAIGQMDGVTQQNAALVEQAAAASQGLQDQAGLLSTLVGRFRLPADPSVAVLAPEGQAQ
ncbi:methyl-accepting chemotaxis protein [Herbaspirillum sp. 1173]|nr:methyl-accepting chemotaxis protein [Herbaspirillum sp. 1173]MDR6743203.1 methyl-accepting chemotaxis protein [Herbaspirillum sp. 1173]